MNDVGYGQFLNPNQLLKLILMHGGNHLELIIEYFYYLDQAFHRISFVELISL